MRFEWSTPLLDFHGQPVSNGDGMAVVLRDLVLLALGSPGKQSPDGEAKLGWYAVGLKIATDADINVTEAALIRQVVCNSTLTPLPVGRICDLLEHPLPDDAT